jgi:hypothetical protein
MWKPLIPSVTVFEENFNGYDKIESGQKGSVPVRRDTREHPKLFSAI